MPASRPGEPSSHVFSFPRLYDLILRLLWGRSEQLYRRRLLELAHVAEGDRVLDVGCGTGTLALAARELVGEGGHVTGVDKSPQMLAFARDKAREKHLEIAFELACADDLPVADSSFDVVVCSTVLHCLDPHARSLAICEMARVLKPRGRILLVDYGGQPAARRSLLAHMKAHARFDLDTVLAHGAEAGLQVHERGAVGFADLYFLLLGHERRSAARSPSSSRESESRR